MSTSCSFATPVGMIRLVAGVNGLVSLSWGEFDRCDQDPTDVHLLLGREELLRYFSGRLRTFTVRVDLSSSQGFTARVYALLRTIPYGETITYGELACRAGQASAARAVGRIMARNPLPIILPCHRVIAANGAMTGYSGGDGIATKSFLLNHERGREWI